MSVSAWIDVQTSAISSGDILRVKLDAYKSDVGKLHNGRLVKVLMVKDGDVHVTSADYKLPYLANSRHAAYKLERKVTVE